MQEEATKTKQMPVKLFFYLKMTLCRSNGYSMIPVVGTRTLSTSC